MATTKHLPGPYSPPAPPAYPNYTPPNSQGHPQSGLIHQQFYSPKNLHFHTSGPTSPASPLHNVPEENPYLLPLKTSQERQQQQKHNTGFVPAALRVTDRPPRSDLLTPPHSAHGSTDSLTKTGKLNNRPGSRRFNTEPFSTRFVKISVALASIPEEDLASALTTADLPEITRPADRSHWKPDTNAQICDFFICQKKFGLFARRHHCRHCGHVFCNEHSTERVGLDHSADFHPAGEKVRVCDHCAKEWIEWVEARVERVKNGEDLSEPPKTGPMAAGKAVDQADLFRGGFAAASLGGPAEWSTF